MRCWAVAIALAVGVGVTLASWPADAQSRRGVRQDAESYQPGKRAPTRITVRKQRSYLDPGTEVLPMSRNYTDYALPVLHYPSRIWDTTNNFHSTLPNPLYLPNFP